MKKVILFTVFALVISLVSFAQLDNKFKFSLGAEFGVVTGSYSNGYSFGIGGTGQAEFPIQDKLKGTVTGGIVFYNGKSIGGGQKNTGISAIPIRVGGKYYLTSSVYGALQIGVGFLNKGLGTAFAYSPQIGYEFLSKNNKPVDIGFKYDAYAKNGTLGSLGIRLALVL
jgi:hypothetical protein